MITFVDEVTGGPPTSEWTGEIAEETLSLADLIRQKVVEQAGPGVDIAEQTRITLDALARNRIVVLVDDHQVTEPGEIVRLRAGSRITFLKLVPLVGG